MPSVLTRLGLLLLAGCAAPGPQVTLVGGHALTVNDRGGLDVQDVAGGGGALTDLRLVAGTGSATVEMRVGSFLFSDVEEELQVSDAVTVLPRAGDRAGFALSAAGEVLGFVYAEEVDGLLALTLQSAGANRVGLEADCADDDHFLGAGQQALDVDHVGEAFGLWVSEPGLAKVDSEEPPSDWYTTGTRHQSSYPMPWVLRPAQSHGVLLDANGRVEVDLCASDAARFSLVAWSEDTVQARFAAAETPVAALGELVRSLGPEPALPAPWVFTPWGDAIRGPGEVDRRADLHRSAGASVSSLWTEDWRGAIDSAIFGYHPAEDWDLGDELYPDAAAQAASLERRGFQWLAYFAPFVTEGTETWDDAVAHDALVRTDAGEIYTFPGAFLDPVSTVDLSPGSPGRDWARGYMEDCLALGFDGWMADFAEWLPHDAVLFDGSTGATAHNAYPLWWQEVHAEAVAGTDAMFFVRSGWTRSPRLAPITWAGDQRTSFQADDGLPTVVPMGLGAGASGVPVFTHDVAGYQSATNDPTDAELWHRWAALGAFSPILRTHHGNESLDNHQFDTDPETTAAWARWTQVHMELFPYRYGLAAHALASGEPMVLPPALVFPDDDPARIDAWLLGPSLFVAPVLERGVTTLDVALPPGPRWLDWWTRTESTGGPTPVPLDHIPVFVAEGSVVPHLVDLPDTAVESADDALTTLSEVDDQRDVLVFGAGGTFTEADGTTYAVEGAPQAEEQVAWTGTAGTVEVAGITVSIDGPIERTYTLHVIP